FGRHDPIAGKVALGKNEYMTFNEWSMVGNNEKRISLFENVRSKITAQTKCTIGIDCISFQGGIAPIQHPDGSLLINLVVHSLIPGETVGADLSCTSPIYRPWFSSTNFPNAPLSIVIGILSIAQR